MALQHYRTVASTYDRGGAGPPYASLRPRAVEHLHLRKGDRVLDAGCGTGLSIAILEQAVGPRGMIIAVDQSPEMLNRARARAEEAGWQNVTFIESPVEDAAIPLSVDAAMVAFSHDIMSTPAALENILRHIKPGGRFSVVGVKWASGWATPFNVVLWFQFRRGCTAREGLGRPWRHLERMLPNVKVRRAGFFWRRGEYYFAFASVPASPR